MKGWVDSSSYSQREPHEGLPRSYRVQFGKFTLSLTRVHIHYPDKWILHIFPDLLHEHELGDCREMSARSAQIAALQHFTTIIQPAVNALDDVVTEMGVVDGH